MNNSNKHNTRRSLALAAAVVLCALGASVTTVCNAADAKVLYQNDFSKGEVGKVPEDLLVLDGGFAVQEVNGNKVLQLPGAPLDTYGVLFGPTETADLAVTARVHSTKKGRREPAFALGLNGNAGYKLQVSASKKLIELFKGDESVAQQPFTWESDSWTRLKLQVRKTDAGYTVEGKAWKDGSAEPGKWLIAYTDKGELNSGRPSLWGNPFAGTPIDFDDIVVTAAQ